MDAKLHNGTPKKAALLAVIAMRASNLTKHIIQCLLYDFTYQLSKSYPAFLIVWIKTKRRDERVCRRKDL